jgi:hypothetical protein
MECARPARSSDETRDGAPEELQAFGDEFRTQEGVSGNIPTGRAKATSSSPTGSPTLTATMGIVVVACLAARAAGVAPRDDNVDL